MMKCDPVILVINDVNFLFELIGIYNVLSVISKVFVQFYIAFNFFFFPVSYSDYCIGDYTVIFRDCFATEIAIHTTH